MLPDQTANPLLQFIPFIAIFLIFYLLVIKPEKQKQNERKTRLANLKKNDEVITVGGIHGTVVNIKQTTIILRVDDNVKLEVDKESITTVKTA
jgi:preprotein translocase subunit YajC